MRRLIILLLSFSMIVSTITVVAYAEERGLSTEEKDLLSAVTNITLDDEVSDVTRAEFCRLIYRIDKTGAPTATKDVFSDVSLEGKYAGFIQEAYERGYICATSDRIFRPDEIITVAEAYTVLLRMAGYGILLDGEYPEASMKYAVQTGLANDIHKVWNDAVDTDLACKMIYNMLFVQTIVSEKRGKYKKGEEYITEVLNIYEDDGVLEAVDGYSLTDEIVVKGNVIINGIEYVDNAKLSFEDIGKRGTYYYKESGIGETNPKLISFIAQRNTEIIIFSGEIVDFADNGYNYEIDGKKRRVRVSPDKYVLYNRKVATDASQLIPDYGTVTLNDNNNDGRYDVVIVNDYYNAYSAYVDKTENKIYYNVIENGAIKKKEIDISDRECRVYDEKGSMLSLGKISDDVVLSVMENCDEVYIYVCTSTVTGVIEKYDGEDNRPYMIVSVEDETEKREIYCSENIYSENWNGTGGVHTADLYLDVLGNVAVVNIINDTQWLFGYVIKAGYDTDQEAGYVKMLCDDSVIRTVMSNSKKLKLDGIKYSPDESFNVNITADSVIRYKVNKDGEIIAIDLPEENNKYENKANSNDEYDCLLKRHDAYTIYKPNTCLFKMHNTTAANSPLHGEAYNSDATIVFSVPEKTTDATREEDYYVTTSIPWDFECRTVSYATDASSLAADVIVCYGNTNGYMSSSVRALLIKKIYTVYDDNTDEATYMVEGMFDNQMIKKYVSKDIVDKFSEYKPGDYMKAVIVGDYIENVELIYSRSGGGIMNSSVSSTSDRNAYIRYVKCTVEKIENDLMLVSYNEGGTTKYEIFSPNGYIYIYDFDKPKEAHIGSVNEIRDSRYSKPDKIIISALNTQTRDIFVMRNVDND